MIETTLPQHDMAGLDSYGGGPLMILGAAGTGKTTLLIARYRWLLEQGAPPERLALLAPTSARADALRGTLEQQLAGGFGDLVVVNPAEFALAVLTRAGTGFGLRSARLTVADRLAMLAGRIDELPLRHHDFGGNAKAMLGVVVRRIDRLKAELIDADQFAVWAQRQDSAREREFAKIFQAYERMLREQGVCDDADLIRRADEVLADGQSIRQPFQHVLIDDAQELDLCAAVLARRIATGALTVAGDPLAGATRFRGAGIQRLHSFQTADTRVAQLRVSHRCATAVNLVARALASSALAARPVVGEGVVAGAGLAEDNSIAAGSSGLVVGEGVFAGAGLAATGSVEFWRCENQRAQAQAVAAEIERLIARDGVAPGELAVLVADIAGDGQAVAVALEERAVPHRLVADASFFQRAEVRDVLAWLRLLIDPGDASAVVRALARPPIELRSIDIARCTQIARRRKLDMVAALQVAIQSPRVPPEARERISVFLKLYSAAVAQLDTTRPELYVHRLIERLGLRRQQLFGVQSDDVERLRALARFGELAAAHVARSPLLTAREFARSVATVAEYGLREREEPLLTGAQLVQVLPLDAAGGLEVERVFVVGLDAALTASAELSAERVPDELLHEQLPTDDEQTRTSILSQRLYVAVSRARVQAVLAYAQSAERGTRRAALPIVEQARMQLGGEWRDVAEDLFGPAETLHATLKLLRQEMMEGTHRTAGRIAELRLDTDLDVSHAVVRYLEMLKLTALVARAEAGGDAESMAEAIRDINARIGQAVTAQQREIFVTSPLDDYLLDGERGQRHRTGVLAARGEPSLERFLPLRGDGVVLSATDIDTYRACPLRYKFARVLRIPREPTVHQRFGIAVHQALERFHLQGVNEEIGPLTDLLQMLDQSLRRAGIGGSDEERQLRDKATVALTRYHHHARTDPGRPVWFERQFSFRLGAHLIRGRVDRIDRLPSGAYELIDYKTGRPKSAEQLSADVQLSLYAVAAREAWGLESTSGVYYYLLDDQRVAIAGDPERADWIRNVAATVAVAIRAQQFEPTPSPRACGLCDYRLLCPAVER
ncbi:MAG: PD-(D/E)XK nuclease family protein [Solirubrobacteraceae bacterium]